MPKIVFRGQTYNHESEMPYEVRQAYIREKERRAEEGRLGTQPLSDMVDMSPEVKAIYERALDRVEDKLPASQQPRNLPRTLDIPQIAVAENPSVLRLNSK